MREVLLDLALEITAPVLTVHVVVVQAVPLVERQHECSARFEHEVDDAHVLLTEGLRDVEDDHGDLCLLERCRRAQRRVEVGALLQVHAATDAGRVDEAPQLSADLDDLVDGVAGRAREFVHDDALLACRLVEQ